MTRSTWLKAGALTVAVAVLSHWAVINYAPQLAMWRFATIVAAEGQTNAAIHFERANAAFRKFPAPSPDLFYSMCVFDVEAAPVEVTMPAPSDTYWSAAFYAANGDNFFVVNDKSAKGARGIIVIVGANSAEPALSGGLIAKSPSTTGIVIIRTLINDDAREAELDRERREASCKPLSP